MKFCSAVKPLLLVLVIALPAWPQSISFTSQPIGFCPTGKNTPVGAITLQVTTSRTTTSGSYIALAPEFTLGASTAPVLTTTPTNPLAGVTLEYQSGTSIIFIRFNAAVMLGPPNSFQITGLTMDATSLPIGTTKAFVDVESSVGSTFTFSGPSSTNVGNADSTACPATLTASSTSLSFRAPPGGGIVVPPQTITITSANSQNFATPVATASTDTGGNWLSAAVGGSNNSYTITVQVDPTGLVFGKYTGKVRLAVTNTTNSPFDVSVTFFIFDGPLLTSTSVVGFRTSLGVDPPSQKIVLRTSDPGVPLPTMSIMVQSPTGGTWLKATAVSGTDPTANNQAILTVTIAPQTGTLAASVTLPYKGLLVFTSDLAQPPTLNVSVELQVDAQPPQITLNRSQVGFSAAANSTTTIPPSQAVLIGNAGGGTLAWTTNVTTAQGGNWLSVTPTTGTGSINVSITANPTGLAIGTYTGSVSFSVPSASNTPQVVTVTLAVGAVPLALSSQTVAFCPTLSDAAMGDIFLKSVSGGAVTSGSTITVSLPSPLSATAAPKLVTTPTVPNVALTVSGQVLTITFGGGVTLPENTQLQITGLRLDASKILGTQANATAAVSSGSTFILSPTTTTLIGNADVNACPARITLSPAQLSFAVPAGSTSASSQTFLVGNNGGGTFAWSVAAATDNGGPWLSVNPSSGTDNKVITVLVNPTNLAAGAYTGAITITSANATNSPQKVAVTLTVGNAPTIADRGIKNSASFSDGLVAANSFLSIFGSNLADSTTSAPAFVFPLPPTLGNAQVKVNGTAAPLFFVSPAQINFLLPSEVTGGTVSILVSKGGVDGAPTSVPLGPAVPGLFTTNAQGTGAGAILKADFSVVSATNPAVPGSVIVLFGGAMGPVNPPVPSGFAAPTDPVSVLVAKPTVTIGGQSATVEFAGLTPGLSGLYQINVRIPAGITTGPNVPVSVTVGGQSSNQVTVAVQ